MLYVPNLFYNLLSIGKLTKDLNCITKFSSTCCEFQDLASERMIGSAKKCERLYLLEVNKAPEKQTQSSSCGFLF